MDLYPVVINFIFQQAEHIIKFVFCLSYNIQCYFFIIGMSHVISFIFANAEQKFSYFFIDHFPFFFYGIPQFSLHAAIQADDIIFKKCRGFFIHIECKPVKIPA